MSAPLAELSLIQILSQRLDAMAARVELTQFGSRPPRAFACVDSVTQPEAGVVLVQGWAFAYGYAEARIVVTIDGIETANGVNRVDRPDVVAAYAAGGPVQGWVGAVALVDMSVFADGWHGDHQHVVQFRVYPPTYTPPAQPPFPLAVSAAVAFVSVGTYGG